MMDYVDAPEIAYGKSLDDDDVNVIKVLDGDYEGTVYRYTKVSIEESSMELSFSTELLVAVYNSEVVDAKEFDMVDFNLSVAKPVMQNMLVDLFESDSIDSVLGE